MTELAPGLRHWSARHPKIGWVVSSYAFEEEGVLVNPLLRDGDRGVLDGIEVHAIVLTNRHHLRDSEVLAVGGIRIHAPAAGMDDLRAVQPPVEGFEGGDELPGGLRAISVGGLSPDEFAVFSANHRALAVADGVMRDGDGPLQAMPDELLGEDPAGVRRGLGEVFGRLCDELHFDHLLLAHGQPIVGDGRVRLRQYAEALR